MVEQIQDLARQNIKVLIAGGVPATGHHGWRSKEPFSKVLDAHHP